MGSIMNAAVLTAALATAACRLHPLVDDVPGASSHLLPRGAAVPSVLQNPELASQIGINDGLDDTTLATAGGVIGRGTGLSAGAAVRYWSFGPGTRAPSPLYIFYQDTGSGLTPIDHPALIDALPGDRGYSALHTITQVVTTSAYAGELITTPAALADAIELGLVNVPVPTASFVMSPVVLPGTALDVGASAPAQPETVYEGGYAAALFRFGGALGVQPGSMLLPTSQVSFLREANKATFDATRPIFQATIPTTRATTRATYTPLSVVIDVDLVPAVTADMVTQDSQLFTRSAAGAITGTTLLVAQFQITTSILLLQLQFTEGQP